MRHLVRGHQGVVSKNKAVLGLLGPGLAQYQALCATQR